MPGKKRVHFSSLLSTDDFRVDAVLPADLGGAPRANRQHTKARPSIVGNAVEAPSTAD
jgi:hypothetical protein